MSPDQDKRKGILKKIWSHPAFKNAMKNYNLGMWLFDGNKLAWSPTAVESGEVRVVVDLDEGKPAPTPTSKKRRDNKIHLILRQTTVVQVSTLRGYLERKISFNDSVQEALNFMDHLIRQGPSERLLAIKRNFYQTQEKGRPLLDGTVVEVHKGTYASLRLSHNLARGGMGLALNADVANTCFWVGRQTVDQLACYFLASCERRWQGLKPADLANQLRPVRGKSGLWESSDAFKHLRKLRKLKFTVNHANRQATDKVYTLSDLSFDQKFGGDGASARTVKFEYNGQDMTVADYYAGKYKAFLRYGNLPLIDAGKGGYIPMEFAWVEPLQRYPFKLNPEQTAAMIKIAVNRPADRKREILQHVSHLQIQNDPYLKHYGVNFEPQFTKTEASILSPPTVNFGQGNADPKFSGRWDLRGKKFWRQNMAPLESWGFIVMDNCVNLPQLKQFSQSFKSAFIGHGGKCTTDPLLLNVPGNIRQDPAQAVAWAHSELVKARGYPQLLFIVVQHRNSPHYLRLKKSADCRFGILTQIVNGQAVANNNGQYHSNVCMKVNAKLGGATSRTMPPWRSQPTYFPKDRPTMIVGVDVSHAAPGGVSPSVAAMTMSVDRDATRYTARVETNGYRTEMLTKENVHTMFGGLTNSWKAAHDNSFPRHIIYFRDGVSEGQFAHVIDQEIGEIKNFLKQKAPPNMALPKFTVIVATKRHHIRFFPQKGDKNGNALPGTLVESEVTHPFMWDFYLCSHVAIQGTARPVHYHVLIDEMGIPVNDLQKMIYHQCYTYARSTTPVSLHPAVYYAHLAGNRARAHENFAASDGIRAGGKGHEIIRDQVAKGHNVDAPIGTDPPKLLALGGEPESAPVAGEMRQREFFRGTMWYI